MSYLALQQIWRPMSQGQSETSLHFRAESVSQLRTSAYAIAKSESQSPGIRATTDMLERYPISFPNVTSWSLV
jgi:hypothetical protein